MYKILNCIVTVGIALLMAGTFINVHFEELKKKA